jgi:hypothetical protein
MYLLIALGVKYSHGNLFAQFFCGGWQNTITLPYCQIAVLAIKRRCIRGLEKHPVDRHNRLKIDLKAAIPDGYLS